VYTTSIVPVACVIGELVGIRFKQIYPVPAVVQALVICDQIFIRITQKDTVLSIMGAVIIGDCEVVGAVYVYPGPVVIHERIVYKLIAI